LSTTAPLATGGLKTTTCSAKLAKAVRTLGLRGHTWAHTFMRTRCWLYPGRPGNHWESHWGQPGKI